MKKFIFSALVMAIMAVPAIVSAQAPAKSKADAAAGRKDAYVLITTDLGNMKIRLYKETPQHRDNFVKLVEGGYYDSLMFHRVIKGFMIQGGDPDSKRAAAGAHLGSGGPGYTVPAEFSPSLIHKKGALAAARDGNPAKASSGSQFYIVQGKTYTDEELNNFDRNRSVKYTAEQRKAYTTVGGTPQLDMNYTVYGEVVEGMDVIDKIAAVQTAPGDRPVKDIRMKMKVVSQ